MFAFFLFRSRCLPPWLLLLVVRGGTKGGNGTEKRTRLRMSGSYFVKTDHMMYVFGLTGGVCLEGQKEQARK